MDSEEAPTKCPIKGDKSNNRQVPHSIDLAKVVESGHEIRDKAQDDVAKVVVSEYEIHDEACDDLVKVVESKYEIHGKACDNVAEVYCGVP